MNVDKRPTVERPYASYMLRRYDPYGMWKIELPTRGGSAPVELRGWFTSDSHAQKAIDAYFRKLKQERDPNKIEYKKPRDKEAVKEHLESLNPVSPGRKKKTEEVVEEATEE